MLFRRELTERPKRAQDSLNIHQVCCPAFRQAIFCLKLVRLLFVAAAQDFIHSALRSLKCANDPAIA